MIKNFMTQWRHRFAGIGMVLLALSAEAVQLAAKESSVQRTYDFNSGWKMHIGDPAHAAEIGFDDQAWQAVTLPRAMNETEAFAKDIHQLTDGIVWYRKHFRLPAGVPADHAILEFQGARMGAEVFVNGQSVGLSENGVMAFGVEMAGRLKPGDNLVAVRVDSSWNYREKSSNSAFQWNNKNFYANYGGINKPVRLHLTGKLYQTLPLYSTLGTTGTYIWTDGFDIHGKTANVHLETQVRNDDKQARSIGLQVSVRHPDGKVVASFSSPAVKLNAGETRILSAQQRLKQLNFWSWGYGYLYTVSSALVENKKLIDVVETRTGFRSSEFANGMFKLNGRVMQIHGYAQRSTNEWPAVGMSVPPWISDLSNGLMVEGNANLVRWMHVAPSRQDVASADRVGLLQAMPAGDAEGDPVGRRFEHRLEVMRDAIIYFRNNPSILFYESGNSGISEAHMQSMKALRDQYDPHGGRAIGSREMLDSGSAEYGGEMLYINKSARQPFWAMEYSRDEGARAFADHFTPPFHPDSPSYNRNQDSMAIENVSRWWDYYQQRPGAGERVSSGGVNIGWADANSHFRGDNNYRRSGEVDAMRLPKDSYYANQVMWDGWVNSEGQHTHILGHWNYAAGVVKDISVISNAEKVELFLNARSLGFGKKSVGFLYNFKDIAFVPGNLKAVAHYADGSTSQQSLNTAGAPAALRLTPHVGPRGLVADGADLMLVDVEVLDKEGQRVPTAFHPVTFSLDGAAEWKGGIAQGREDNYILAKTLPVELGINRVILRSTNKAGFIHLKAQAEGLPDAELNLHSVPFAVQDGLASDVAEGAQALNLNRGATPLSASYRPFRQGLKVGSIRAGSNAADTALSHDDNERTSWSSDGTQAGAWIEYELDQVQTVNALSLKLIGWRLRAYPIRVSVDESIVFEGVTAKSLGYVDLTFAPSKGQRVRITLIGPTEDRDAFGKIVELKGNKEAISVGADRVATGWRLSLVEADILGPVN